MNNVITEIIQDALIVLNREDLHVHKTKVVNQLVLQDVETI